MITVESGRYGGRGPARGPFKVEKRERVMSELLLTYRGMVHPCQCDRLGRMSVMWYTGKFDEASRQMLARLGLTSTYLHERNSVVSPVRHETSHRQELRAGDIVSIRSSVIEVREKVIRFMHEMREDESGTIVAVSAVTAVHMDAETRRASAFPPDFLNRVRQYLSDHGPADPEAIHDTLPQQTYPPAASKPAIRPEMWQGPRGGN